MVPGGSPLGRPDLVWPPKSADTSAVMSPDDVILSTTSSWALSWRGLQRPKVQGRRNQTRFKCLFCIWPKQPNMHYKQLPQRLSTVKALHKPHLTTCLRRWERTPSLLFSPPMTTPACLLSGTPDTVPPYVQLHTFLGFLCELCLPQRLEDHGQPLNMCCPSVNVDDGIIWVGSICSMRMRQPVHKMFGSGGGSDQAEKK